MKVASIESGDDYLIRRSHHYYSVGAVQCCLLKTGAFEFTALDFEVRELPKSHPSANPV